MKALNSKQKNGLWLGIALAVFLGMNPPWIEGPGGAPGAYAPIYAPPVAVIGHPAWQIDFSRLLLQWGLTALVTVGLIVTGQEEPEGKKPFKQKPEVPGAVVQSQPAVFVTKEGVDPRHLKFPDKSSLGELLIESVDDPDYWEWVADAQGDVELPATSRIQLELRKDAGLELGSLGRTEMAALVSIDASDSKLKDGDLVLIAALKNLQELDLTNTEVTDAGLEHLSRLKQLQKLWLDGTKVTDQGINSLKQLPNLTKVSFASTQVSDSSIITLRSDLQDKCQFVLSNGQDAS